MNKIFALLAVSSLFALTSCIEETFPENGTATAEQIAESSSALEAAVNGIPSQMCQGYYVYGEQTHETDMAFPQFMIAQTELLGDMYPEGSNSGYDWRSSRSCSASHTSSNEKHISSGDVFFDFV